MIDGPWPRLLSPIAQTKWQVLFSLATTAFMLYLFSLSNDYGASLLRLGDKFERHFLYPLLSLVALTTSISIGFLYGFMQLSNSRKFDLYYKSKAEIKDGLMFLRGIEQRNSLVFEAEESLFRLINVSFKDFATFEWHKTIAPFLKEFYNAKKLDGGLNLGMHVLVRFRILEEIFGQMQVITIRQIVAHMFLQPIVKSLLVLLAGICTLVFSMFLFSQGVLFLFMVTTLFLYIFTSLVLCEIVYWIARETLTHGSEVGEEEEPTSKKTAGI